MSKTKSTPGPWNVGSLPPAGWRYICDSKGETLAAVAEWDEDGTLHLEFPNAKANARLIAAAPDLLAALKDLLEPDAVGMERAIDQAHLAIIKAEGA